MLTKKFREERQLIFTKRDTNQNSIMSTYFLRN